MSGDWIDFAAQKPVGRSLPERWEHGARSARRNKGPKIQVHSYDEHTFVLRQSKSVSFEAPFLYLFLGNERALLLDTGATADPARCPVRATVDAVIDAWLGAHPREGYELVVAHTHGHGDHVAGDAQFADRPGTTVVDRKVESVRAHFGFAEEAWPAEIVTYDLGGRVLELTGIPGHHAASVAVYDPWSGFLVTGDTVLPGRLYAFDFPAFTESLDRLVAITLQREVSAVMGCHIEMTTKPRRDYPIGATYQPDEPPLQMTVRQLAAARDAAIAVAERPGVTAFDDFVIYNGQCRAGTLKLLARGLAWRAGNAVAALAGR